MTNKHRFNNNNSFYTANNKMRMDAMSAINDILKVMNRHINNPDVCEHGCDILMCMSVDNGNKNAIAIPMLSDNKMNVAKRRQQEGWEEWRN